MSLLPGFCIPMAMAAEAPLLLDTIATAPVHVWSTRRLTVTYTGSILRVRRSSDNAEQDIGYVDGGELDTSTLLSFVGANDGLVVTLYDQITGNARNLTQATAANQPKIVSGGSLVTVNSNPAIQFDGSSDHLTASTSGLNIPVSAYTIMTGCNPTAAGHGAPNMWDRDGVLVETAGNWFGAVFGSDNFTGGHWSGAEERGVVSTSFPTTRVTTTRFDGSVDTVDVWLDGGTPATDATAADQSGSVGSYRMGGNYSLAASSFLQGNILEVIVYAVALSDSDINTLGADMATRIGTSWSDV